MKSFSGGRLAPAALVVAFLALAGWAVLRQSDRAAGGDASAELQRMQAVAAQLEAEQQSTRRELEMLRHAVAAPAPGAAGRTNPAAAPTREEFERQRQAQQVQLEKAFSASGPPPAGDKAPQLVQRAFTDPGVLEAPGIPDSQQVECRASMCRITAQFPPFQDGDEWGNRMLLEMSGMLPDAQIVTVKLPGGGTELRIYAARQNVRNAFGPPTPPGG